MTLLTFLRELDVRLRKEWVNSPVVIPPTRPTVKPSEVKISASPWVSGYRARSYAGPITWNERVYKGQSFGKALRAVVKNLQVKCAALGCNWICGFELRVDPWFETELGEIVTEIYAIGTAGDMEKLFG